MQPQSLGGDRASASLPSNKRVLLINPPVFDFRYEWVRWNQPLDLLLLATRLRRVDGCDVRLFDFMQPDSGGRVPRRQCEPQLQRGGFVLNRVLTHFGKTIREFEQHLRSLSVAKPPWEPEEIWITSLTSYWWHAILEVAVAAKAAFRDARIVIYGNYPLFEKEHAARMVACADAIVARGSVEYSTETPSFDLYTSPPSFRALDIRAPHVLDLILDYYSRGIRDFVFFNDPFIGEGQEGNVFSFLDRLVAAKPRCPQLRLHGLCGIHPEVVDADLAGLLKGAGFSELHFEPFEGGFEESRYQQLSRDIRGVGYLGSDPLSGGLSAFLLVGLPDDNLEAIVSQMLMLQSLFGVVILKPYSPTPGGPDYARIRAALGASYSPELLSPHRLPCHVFSGLEEDDYLELYRLAAFLNYPVRGHTFDFLGDSYLAKQLSRSFVHKRWSD